MQSRQQCQDVILSMSPELLLHTGIVLMLRKGQVCQPIWQACCGLVPPYPQPYLFLSNAPPLQPSHPPHANDAHERHEQAQQ